MRQHTPWGLADHHERLAPGIDSYSTPSHGGYHLDATRVATMPEALRTMGRPDGIGGRWYEEDCDWSAVALAWPELFPPEAQAHALNTMRNYNPDAYEAVTGEPTGPHNSYMRTLDGQQLAARTEAHGWTTRAPSLAVLE